MVKITNIEITKKSSGGSPLERKVAFPDILSLPIGLKLPVQKEIVLLVGPNGSGKTTLLRGMQNECRGIVDHKRKDTQFCELTSSNPDALSINSNLLFHNRLEADRKAHQMNLERDEFNMPIQAEYARPNMNLYDTSKAANLSTISAGQATIKEIKRLFAKSPESIILLDEPDQNLNGHAVDALGDAILELFTTNNNGQIFLATHNGQLIEALLPNADIINFYENPVSMADEKQYRLSLERFKKQNPNPFLTK